MEPQKDAVASLFAGESQIRIVAQIFNLPYRRVALGKPPVKREVAVRSKRTQNKILRYSRVQLCATSLHPPHNLIRDRLHGTLHFLVSIDGG